MALIDCSLAELEDSDEFLDDEEFEQLCRRASSRLSEVLRPRQLRFSGAPPQAFPTVLEQDDEEGQPTALKQQQQPALQQRQLPQAQPVKVVVRVRPLQLPGAGTVASTAATHGDCVIVPASATDLKVQAPAAAAAKTRPGGQQQELQFSFSRVLGADTTQDNLYAHTTASLVDDLLNLRAKSSVVFAFGSSGAGKTHSIEGSPEDPGLLPRVLENVLQAPQVTSGGLDVSITCFELHNELVYDLLAPDQSTTLMATSHAGATTKASLVPGMPPLPGGRGARPQKVLRHSLLQPAGAQEGARRALKVREDAQGQVVIPGLTVVPVQDLQQALTVQRKASRQRQQAATGVNASSSRSHCIFTVLVRERTAAGSGQLGRTACLSMCDLAGSERAGRTGNEGQRFRESCSINSSLMTLARCLGALRASQSRSSAPPPSLPADPAAVAAAASGAAASGQAPQPSQAPVRVPWRESKLTQVFKEALHGHGNLVLLVAVSPSSTDLDETMHVLRYAALATGITAVPVAPPVLPPAPLQPAPAAPATTLRAKKASQIPSGPVPVPPPPAQQQQQQGAGPEGSGQVAVLAQRVQALEAELASVQAELQRKSQALEDAEADVRSEVVSEVTALLNDLRAHYEDRLGQVADELRAKDSLIEELQRQVHQQQQQQQAMEPERQQGQPQQEATGAAAGGQAGGRDVCEASAAVSAVPDGGAGGQGVRRQQGSQQQDTAMAQVPEGKKEAHAAVQVSVIQEELAHTRGDTTGEALGDSMPEPAQNKAAQARQRGRGKKRTAPTAAAAAAAPDGHEVQPAVAVEADAGAGMQGSSPAPRRNVRRRRA